MAGGARVPRLAGLRHLLALQHLALAAGSLSEADWGEWAPDWPEDWPMLHRLALVGFLALFSVCVWCVACCMCCRRACCPRAEPQERSALGDDVGQYRITLPGTVVKDGASLGSCYLGRLEEGQVVEVLEVADQLSDNRVRAKISYGGHKGWISLRSLDGELVWARRAHPGELPSPSLDVPSYWENWRPHSGTVPQEFKDVFQVRQVDLAAVQRIFDDWADRLSVREPSRLRVRRVERNENSRAWRRYARGQASLSTSSTLGTTSDRGTPSTVDTRGTRSTAGTSGTRWTNSRWGSRSTVGTPSDRDPSSKAGATSDLGSAAGHSSGSGAGPGQGVPDYAGRFPVAMLNTSVSETYLFRRCDFYQLPQVCGDGFVTDVASSGQFMKLSESPYDVDAGDDLGPSEAVFGDGQQDPGPTVTIRPHTCDQIVLSSLGWYDLGGSNGRGSCDDRPCIAMFRAVVGAAPLHWVGSEASLQNVQSGVAVYSSGPGMPRTFFTQAKELVYPEYIVYLEQATHYDTDT